MESLLDKVNWSALIMFFYDLTCVFFFFSVFVLRIIATPWHVCTPELLIHILKPEEQSLAQEILSETACQRGF